MNPAWHIREAVEKDIPAILECIHALAVYEKEPDAVKNTPELIKKYAFGTHPLFHTLMVEDSSTHEILGFAVYFFTYSTWEGKPGLYLEDLFVHDHHRGRGAGLGLMKELARIALKQDCTRFQWQVLDWNTPSIEFYEQLGARRMSEWYTYRMEEDAIKGLAVK